MTSILIVSSALLWVVLLFNLLLTLELVHRINRFLPMPNFYNISTLKVGTPAPDFVAETLDSEIVTLSNFADRAVAFVFTSPNCPGCVKRIPELETLGARAQRHRAELVLVSTVGKAETQAMIEEYRIKLPVLVAPRDSNPFAQDYKAVAVPFYCLVDDEGKVQSTGLLDTDWEELTRKWYTDGHLAA